MSLPFTSVVSYHQNPMTCGVAKFSAELAKRLGVPLASCVTDALWGDHPLLSLKWAEIGAFEMLPLIARDQAYSVFWHDAGQQTLTDCAKYVFYADPSLGSPGLWCPSLLTPSRKRPVRLFSFGMAHKLQTDKYRKVRELLEAAGERYHLRVSVGIHEGTSLDDATKHFDALKEVMGPEHVTILGILSDDAVAEELYNCDYVLAFFEKGVRANNTTVHAAIEAGCEVITTHDTASPFELRGHTRPIDLLTSWPRKYHTYSWGSLIAEMKGVCDRSQ